MKLKWPFISQKRDDKMSDEMAFHIESITRELVRAGMSQADAQFEARRRFGSVLKQKEAGHQINTGRMFEDVMRDARHIGRGLRRRGLKLHFANSRVDYHNPEHIARFRKLFAAANAYRMAIVAHIRTSISAEIPYGAEEARIFLNEIVPAAPDVPIQIAAFRRLPLTEAEFQTIARNIPPYMR